MANSNVKNKYAIKISRLIISQCFASLFIQGFYMYWNPNVKMTFVLVNVFYFIFGNLVMYLNDLELCTLKKITEAFLFFDKKYDFF